MNKLYPVIALTLASSVALYSCKMPEVEIAESNYAYTIDEKKVQVEMPKPFDYSNSNVTLLKNGNVAIEFDVLVTPVSHLIVQSGGIELNLTSRDPLAEDVKFTFRLDPEAAEAAKDEYKDYLPIPLEAFDVDEIVIPKGTKDASFKIRLKESLDFLSEDSGVAGYYCFLHLVSGSPESVLPAKSGNLIAVSVTVEHSNIITEEAEQTDKMYEGVKVTFTTENLYNIGVPKNMTDGNPSNGYVSGAELPEFIFDLTAEKLLSGFRFHAASYYGSPYVAKTAEVWTSTDGQSYTSQGKYTLERTLGLAEDDFGSYRFASPVKARYVKFVLPRWSGYGEMQFFGPEGTRDPNAETPSGPANEHVNIIESIPSDWQKLEVVALTNTVPDRVDKLYDGNLGGDTWWIREGDTNDLYLYFESYPVQGIAFYLQI